jgi:AraC family transcriptional regulator of adaptative response / DNA-3-methyladenine glycosylase II
MSDDRRRPTIAMSDDRQKLSVPPGIVVLVMDDETCYRAVRSRDARFDGWFVTAVRTTGIYCRPSCPATTPRRANVRFLPTAAAAQLAGYRACKRCRPDASPGSPEWSSRSDTVARAMRLIGDGVVDRGGVAALAGQLAYSERQLHRLLVAEVGAGPQALARAQRAHTARVLIETSTLSFAEVAFAAGFASIRQFNETVRAVFATTPTDLRRRGAGGDQPQPGVLHLRLPHRSPIDVATLFGFLAQRAVPGVESYDGVTYRRTLRLPHDEATVALSPGDGHISATLSVRDPRDVVPAVARCRRLLDLDADTAAVDDLLRRDPLLAPLVAARPGLRVPGTVDGAETAVRAVLGQQVSVAGARTLARRLVDMFGKPLGVEADGLRSHFPTADALADADPESLPLPRSRANTLVQMCAAIADGRVPVDCGADRSELERSLLAVPGIGPWTAGYVRMRALGDPDVFLPGDLGVRHGLGRLGAANDPESAEVLARQWSPWRSYALMHLWAAIPSKEKT